MRWGRRSSGAVPVVFGFGRWAVLGIVGVALVGGLALPVIAVFCAAVALNCVLGRRENVPFSTYPMFANPSLYAWTLRFDDANGEPVLIGLLGLNPVFARKRFASEVQAAQERGVTDVREARREAAIVMAGLLDARRPLNGPLATAPVTIAIVEYSLESGHPVRDVTPLMVTPTS